MSDKTLISWTDSTANYANGCTILSPGCTNCYAMRLAGTRLKHHPSRVGLTDQTKAGPVWNGSISYNENALEQVLRWNRPRRIFWNAHSDLFHDAVPDERIDQVFAACSLTPHHSHQILTKRRPRMRAYMAERPQAVWHRAALEMRPKARAMLERQPWPLPQVWLGVSAEDQTRWDERVPDLRATPAAVRWVSAEPLLGSIDGVDDMADLDWVVIGCESGPRARPMPDLWALSLVNQCRATGTAVLVKQLNGHAGKVLRDVETFPHGLQFHEYPAELGA